MRNKEFELKVFLRASIFITLFLLITDSCYAQSLDEDRIALANFVERLHNNSPFEGCRIIDDYDNKYLLSVVVLDPSKYKVKTAMNRTAQVKSQRTAGEFINGTQTYSEFIIKTPRVDDKNRTEELAQTFDVIRSNSTGYIQQMQLLTTFEDDEHMKVYVFYKEL